MFNQKNYNRTARYAETQKKLADDYKKEQYWHGFRRGMYQTLPNFNPEQIERDEAAFDKNSPEETRTDESRGYWDGRDWESFQPNE